MNRVYLLSAAIFVGEGSQEVLQASNVDADGEADVTVKQEGKSLGFKAKIVNGNILINLNDL